jgi:hypothetical protein
MSQSPEYPTVGRIVHQVGRGSADGAFPPVCRAAMVTAAPPTPLPDGAIDLFVIPPRGMFHDDAVPYHPGVTLDTPAAEQPGAVCASGARLYPGGTWHWPERATTERA